MATTNSIYNKLLDQGMDLKVAATKARKLASLSTSTASKNASASSTTQGTSENNTASNQSLTLKNALTAPVKGVIYAANKLKSQTASANPGSSKTTTESPASTVNTTTAKATQPSSTSATNVNNTTNAVNNTAAAKKNTTAVTASGYQQSAAVEEALANLQSLANSTVSAYKSPYESQIQALISEINGRSPFSYNAENDAAYQIYKDQYTDAAKLAMADTMGEAAALTGGYGNSYASTAGNQAYQSYMSELAGKVPELYQAAYDRYNDEGNRLLDRLSMYQTLDESAYARHRDDVNDAYTKLNAANDIYNTLYNQDYGQYRDSVSDDQWNQSFNYQKEQDALAQSNWQKEYDRSVYENDRNYQRSVYESDRDYNLNAQKLHSSLAAAQQETTATGVIDSAEATELYRKMYESGEYEKASDIALQLMNTYMNADEESFLDFAYNFRLPDDNGNVVLLIDLLTDTIGEGTIADSNFPKAFNDYYYTK